MIYNILWTGGLDSTYAVASLAKNTTSDVRIQPFYVIDANRKSYPLELKAIHIITNILNSLNGNDKIFPLKTIKREDIKISNEISCAFGYLKQKYGLGSQYSWLASLATEK